VGVPGRAATRPPGSSAAASGARGCPPRPGEVLPVTAAESTGSGPGRVRRGGLALVMMSVRGQVEAVTPLLGARKPRYAVRGARHAPFGRSDDLR
jgi:hypothetical protein